MLLNGEASMALVWSTRATLIEQDSGGQIKFIWDQGLLSPGAMAVIKGNPGGRDAAMKFIASAQDPKRQLVMFDMLGQGPANPATDALIAARQAAQQLRRSRQRCETGGPRHAMVFAELHRGSGRSTRR